jgi:hypothetical protein
VRLLTPAEQAAQAAAQADRDAAAEAARKVGSEEANRTHQSHACESPLHDALSGTHGAAKNKMDGGGRAGSELVLHLGKDTDEGSVPEAGCSQPIDPAHPARPQPTGGEQHCFSDLLGGDE